MHPIELRRLRRGAFHLPILLLLAATAAPAAEDALEVAVGFSGVHGVGSTALDLGLDLVVGYEWVTSPSWYIGPQMYLQLGSTSNEDIQDDSDLKIDSVAVNATFRPTSYGFNWLQLKAGVAYADYRTLRKNQSGVGYSVGLGMILYPNDRIRFRVLDFARYQIEGDGFNVASFSFSYYHGGRW